LQPVCPQVQSMSGVFSIASHCVLQYLPEVVRHEQTGCAHFTAFSGAILFSYCGSRLSDVGCNGSHRAEPILYRNEHIPRLTASFLSQPSRRIPATTEKSCHSPLDSAPPLVYLMQLFCRCFRPREGPCNFTIESFAFHSAPFSRLARPFPEAGTRVKPRQQPSPG
jgi:hypothetical protein